MSKYGIGKIKNCNLIALGTREGNSTKVNMILIVSEPINQNFVYFFSFFVGWEFDNFTHFILSSVIIYSKNIKTS
jgi:hypothetical protein